MMCCRALKYKIKLCNDKTTEIGANKIRCAKKNIFSTDISETLFPGTINYDTQDRKQII